MNQFSAEVRSDSEPCPRHLLLGSGNVQRNLIASAEPRIGARGRGTRDGLLARARFLRKTWLETLFQKAEGMLDIPLGLINALTR